MDVTRALLDEIKVINETSGYRDAQHVYDTRHLYNLGMKDHVCYWSFWTSCGFSSGKPSSGIKCFVCDMDYTTCSQS